MHYSVFDYTQTNHDILKKLNIAHKKVEAHLITQINMSFFGGDTCIQV